MKIRAMAAPWYDGVELLVIDGDQRGVHIEMAPYRKGEFAEPTARISTEMAQCLMDDLWGAGLRPTEGSGSAGSLKATERHLDDMRRLVFEMPRTLENEV